MSQTKTNYIPAGRTALVVKGEFKLQVQTEYSSRPIPRISSTILCSGELLHRVDVPLDAPIESQEDLATAERLIVRQHGETLKIVSADTFGLDSEFPYESLWLRLYPEANPDEAGAGQREPQVISEESGEPEVPAGLDSSGAGRTKDKLNESASVDFGSHSSLNIRAYQEPSMSDSDKVRKLNRTTLERLYSMEGVEKIVPIDSSGKFLAESAEKDFKRKFKAVYKKLDQALEVFPALPGGRGREEGIYEVESRRLYMVSHGAFVYFVIMRQMPFSRPIEEVIREALDS